MNLIADYDATDADLRLTEQGSGAMLLFLSREGGWVGVTLDRADLVRLQDRIHAALSRPVPPVQRR